MWPELLELKKKEGAFLLSFLLACFSLCIILKPSRMISVFEGISINLAMVLVLLLRNEIENKQRIRKGFYLQSAVCVLTVLSIVCISMFFYHPDSESHYIDKTINRKTINSALINNDANIISEIAKKETSDFMTRLNPLKMPDTAANRGFLRRWFAMISEQNDAISADEIARAVSVNFDYLSDDERLLKNLWESCFSSSGVRVLCILLLRVYASFNLFL